MVDRLVFKHKKEAFFLCKLAEDNAWCMSGVTRHRETQHGGLSTNVQASQAVCSYYEGISCKKTSQFFMSACLCDNLIFSEMLQYNTVYSSATG